MVIACVYSGQGGLGHRWQVGELKPELPELAVHRPRYLPPGHAAAPPQATLHHLTTDDLQRAQQLHAQGRTYIEIGLELGFGRDTVKKHLATQR